MPDIDGADPQDEAEAYDETNREDELGLADEDLFEDPDVARDVYDVTTAIGDADDDAYSIEALDDSEDLDADDIETDEDDDDALDDGLEDRAEDDVTNVQSAVDARAARGHASEPGLCYVADLDSVTRPSDDEAEKYESTRPLSDSQLNDLGYDNKGNEAMTGKKNDVYDELERNADDDMGDLLDPMDTGAIGEHRSFKGTGAKASDIDDDSDAGDEARLDEGLEETFPASDPVSAKHIT